MELKYTIGLSVQGSEHRRSQEFGLGANQKRKKVQSRGYMFQSLIQVFTQKLQKAITCWAGPGTDFLEIVMF